ncbi:hypothetical protein BDN72DRAFT_838270 [Pluteus cervinus]|uniref:Uncharacterized protein n=1 Tax=Pluteus cervinus TaxID=181527 RepID=A0ACD3AZR4_9AGAR|nr:hypothetical protein BDN72DRAFT_838270 [Pluteus cervinus]
MTDSDDLTPITANAVLLIQYFTVASSTVYLYDLLLTLDLEVNLLWPSKWTLVKVVYLLQRYLPLVDTVILAMAWQFGDINPWTCKLLFRASSWSLLVGMTLSEVILIRRTIAVWNNNRKLRITIFLFFLCCITPIYWMLGHYHDTLTYHLIQIPQIPGLHCSAKGKSHLNFLCWTFLTVYDTGLLVLTAIPAFRARRSSGAAFQSTLIHAIYRDGVLYYLYLVALSAINVILTLKLPSDYAILLLSLERVIYSILTSRVVLHIREQAYQSQVISLNLPNLTNTNTEAEFRRSEI